MLENKVKVVDFAKVGASNGNITFNIETIKRVDLPSGLRINPEDIDVPATSGGIKLTSETKLIYIQNKIREKESKFSLSPLTNQIVAIAIKLDNGEICAVSGNNEYELLRKFYDVLSGFLFTPRFVGFNSKAFDFPILAIALRRHNIYLPFHYKSCISRYNDDSHVDVRMLLTGNNQFGEGSLGDWCEVFGIERPFGFGRNVQQWFDSGDFESIERHCSENVDRTYKLFSRLSGMY